MASASASAAEPETATSVKSLSNLDPGRHAVDPLQYFLVTETFDKNYRSKFAKCTLENTKHT